MAFKPISSSFSALFFTDPTDNPHSQPGQRLFDTAQDFYAWHLSWDRVPLEHAQTYRILSQILQVAKRSFTGGSYLKEEEENGALAGLYSLKEKFFDGNLRQSELQQKLRCILDKLINENAKARLVAYATDIEFIFCPAGEEQKKPESIQSLRKQLAELIQKVGPSLTDFRANAIAQGLAQMLLNPRAVDNPQKQISAAIGNWLH